MILRPVDAKQIDLVFGWLTDELNSRWLDFACGRGLQPVALKLMLRDERHLLRLFAPRESEAPIGIVALSEMNRRHKTATLWYVLGDRSHQGRGCTTKAVSRLLRLAFGELGLRAINAWTVAENVASSRILKRNGFQLIGRQRCCHWLEGRAADRLLFDLLSEEFRGVMEVEPGERRSPGELIGERVI